MGLSKPAMVRKGAINHDLRFPELFLSDLRFKLEFMRNEAPTAILTVSSLLFVV